MATNTSKGLVKPTDAENQDVAVINANMDRINDYALGAFVCTSTTRPTGSNLWDGMIIKETDSKAIGFYDLGTAKWHMFDTIPQLYTPAITGIALGGGATVGGSYMRNGLDIHCKFSIIVGAGLFTGTAPKVSTPFPLAAINPFTMCGHGTVNPAGAYAAMPVLQVSTTTVQLQYLGVNGVFTDITPTAPAGFVNTGFMIGEFWGTLA